jgi:nucleotide-binding universal stress UspA family protein
MFTKILAAVDGSNHSDRAVVVAAELAAASGGKLLLCHASYIPEPYRSDLVGDLREAIRKDGEDILTHAARVAKAHGLDVEARLLEEGRPAEAVLGLADKEGADLIVVGARGKSKDAVRELGSVSLTISKLAKCSVMIVRKG